MKKYCLAAISIFSLGLFAMALAPWFRGRPPAPVSVAKTAAASPVKRPAETSAPAETRSILSRIMDEGLPELSPAEIEAFVASRSRDALSLAAAWQLSGDPAWLEEAARLHPDDPRVAAAILLNEGAGPGNRQWIESLKRHDPDNAIGALYGARAAFAEGDMLTALAELEAVSGKPRADFFTGEVRDAMIEAYRHAGHGSIEAELAGGLKTAIPASDMMRLSRDISAAISAAHENGDRNTAGMLARAGMDVASRMPGRGGDDYLILQLTGISMQRQILNQMDVFDLIPGEKILVADRLAAMDAQIAETRELISQAQNLLPALTNAEAAEYTRRFRERGEAEAMRWLTRQGKNR